MIRKNLGEKYVPMYHLGALGSGGLAISFFLYLNFLLPHESGIISFDQLWPIVTGPLTAKSFWVGVVLVVVLRQSDRTRAEQLCGLLKERIMDGQFLL